MKRLITTSVILFFAFCAYAQDTNKTITLHEITVKAAKVVNRPDGMTIYPTDAQKQASTAFLKSSHSPIFVSTTSTTQFPLSTTEEAFK